MLRLPQQGQNRVELVSEEGWVVLEEPSSWDPDLYCPADHRLSHDAAEQDGQHAMGALGRARASRRSFVGGLAMQASSICTIVAWGQ